MQTFRSLVRLSRASLSDVSRVRFFSSTGASEEDRSFTPRRSLMYVPGNDERKIGKIPQLRADCICLDCEDGVALNMKEAARTNIRDILDTGRVDFGRSECSVRLNSVDSGLCMTDMETILGGERLPAAVHLPKVETSDQLAWFAGELNTVLSVQPDRKLGLIMFIESAQALLDLPNICRAAWELSDDSFFVPEALVFGSDDFAADIGATRTKESSELLYARQAVVAAARAFKLQAIDMVYIDYKDLEGLEKQSLEGARFGFTGKQVIHPAQVPVVQRAFSPAPERVEWARALIAAFQEQQAEGRGAFTFRGHMIDMPTVKQARNVLALVTEAETKGNTEEE